MKKDVIRRSAIERNPTQATTTIRVIVTSNPSIERLIIETLAEDDEGSRYPHRAVRIFEIG